MATTQNNAPLAAPYSKKVGRVIFQVSSFADPKEKHTAEQMILSEVSMLAEERRNLHDDSIKQARKHIQTAYKDKYDSQQFKTAKTETADSLNEPEQDLTVRQKMKEMEEHVATKTISSAKNKSRGNVI